MDAMLIELFGVGWTNLIGTGVEDGSFGSVLGILFGIFNAAVALVTVGILFLLAATAIADTARTGQVMGPKGSIWVPLRAAFAAALLVPIVKGFSLLQVLILSLVVSFSVGLANTMANHSVEYLNFELGGFTDPIASQVNGVAEQMLYTSVCHNYFNLREYHSSQGAAGQIVAEHTEEVANGLYVHRWSFNGDAYSGQGEAACGAYLITCPDQLPDTLKMCQQQFAALRSLKSDLDYVAVRLIEDRAVNSADVAEAALKYEQGLRTALKERLRKIETDKQRAAAGNELVNSIEQNGFAFLGQWYMTLAAINQRNLSYAKATLDSLPLDLSKSIENRLGIYGHLKRAQSLVQLKSSELVQTSGALTERAIRQREMAGVLGSEGTLGDYLAGHSQLHLNGKSADGSALFALESDPLSGLQQLGSTMVTLTSAYWSEARMPGIKINRSDKDDEVSEMLTRVSGALGSSRAPDQKLEGELGTFANYIMIVLFLAGLTLMYYIPAIPFIVWTFSVIAYLSLILQSLIAAPLWAASHALPNGSGLSSDASKQGYVLLLNLAIRPPLMVIGLLAGGALMAIAAQFAVMTFDVYSASLLASRVEVSSLLSFATLFVVEVMILVALVHKSFALVYQASDRAVEWVTGQSRTNGEAGDEQRVSGAAAGAQRSGEAALGRASYSTRASQASQPDPADNQNFR